jgi:DNA-binding MarR family transcriptional regulator
VDRTSLAEDMYALAAYMMRSANVGTFEAIADLDLSFTQIKTLCALDAEGDERSLGSLAESLGISLATMSRSVDGLFERRLVMREEDPADRRMKRVRLTPAGRKVPEALTEARLSALHELIDSLGEADARALADALGMILAGRPDIAQHRPAEGRER